MTEKTKDSKGKDPKTVLRLLNRILTVLLIAWLGLFASVFVIDAFHHKKEEPKEDALSLGDHKENLEDMREHGDYMAVADYLSEHSLSLYDEGMEEYWQYYEILSAPAP